MQRDLCIDWMWAHPKQIGGPGHVVQIDESAVSSAKAAANRRTRQFRQRWVFGGIDKATDEAFLVEVDCRDAATLLPIIQQHILPGNTVWSDQWAAYRGSFGHTHCAMRNTDVLGQNNCGKIKQTFGVEQD